MNELIDRLIDLAFAEDIGDGDHTTLSCIPATAKKQACWPASKLPKKYSTVSTRR